MKDSAKLVMGITIMVKIGITFFSYLWRDHEIGAILTSNGVTMSIEKVLIMNRHHNEK